MNAIPIINTILPVILMLAVGMIFRAKNIISREGIDSLKKFVVNCTLPVFLFGVFATMEYTVSNIILTVIMYVLCILMLLFGKVLKLIFREKSRFLPYITTGFEAGMIGYSLYLMLYGGETIGSFASVDLGQTLFVFTLYKMLLGAGEGENKLSGKQVIVEMFKSPVFIALIAGVIIGATGLYTMMMPSGASSVIDTCVDFISAPTAAVILVTIGYDLVPKHIPWIPMLKAVASRIIVMIVARIAMGYVARAIGLGDSLDHAFNILFICPPPYVLPIFSTDEKQLTYISSTISVATFCSVIAFIILVFVENLT